MGATWSALEETGLVAGVMAPSPVAVPDDDMPFAPTKSVAAVPRVRRNFVASPALRLALSNYTGSAIETDASSQQSSMHAQACAVHCMACAWRVCMACHSPLQSSCMVRLVPIDRRPYQLTGPFLSMALPCTNGSSNRPPLGP